MSKILPFAALLITLALIGISSIVPLQSMWGVNHLQYLPPAYEILLVITIVAIVALGFGGRRLWFIERLIEQADRLLFGWGWRSTLLVTALFSMLFYLFRIDTYLLGDGYLLLAVTEQNAMQALKWSETGSLWLIRMVQAGLGENSGDSALHAFQILSYGSGAIAIYNFLRIAQRMSEDARVRLLAIATLAASGSLLLFLGYVEVYPVVWAAVAVFLNVALRYCDTGKGLAVVLLAFVVAVLLHLQVLLFAPSVAYLVSYRFRRDMLLFDHGNRPRIAAITAYVLLVLAILWLSRLRIDLEVIFLPPITGRPASPDYAIFSMRHLVDVLNLLFLVIPGWLSLAVLIGKDKREDAETLSARRFLFLSVIGSITFLFVVDPSLGMARDWDLMSVTLLPLGLYLLIRLLSTVQQLEGRYVVAYSITALVASVLFLAAQWRPSQEMRALHLLKLYGAKNNSGWVVLADYFRNRGDYANTALVSKEMRVVFPNDTLLVHGFGNIDQQRYAEAFSAGERLVEIDPYRAEYRQLLGNAFGKLGKTDSATANYKKAIALRPYDARLRNEFGQLLLKAGRSEEALNELQSAHELDQSLTFVLEGIGLAYFNLGYLDSASQTATKIFALDLNQPGGHLLEMVIDIRRSDTVAARQHFEEYLKYGRSRSDFARISEYYGYLSGK